MIRMLSLAAGAIACFLAMSVAPKAQAEPLEWKMHIIWADTRPEAEAYRHFVSLANEKAGGEFHITLYPGGSLGIKDQDILRVLPAGTAFQLAGLYPGYMTRDAESIANIMPPAVVAEPQQIADTLPILTPVYQEVYSKWGVKLLGYVGHPVRDTFVFCKEPVDTLEKLKSKKTRVWEKFYADIFDRLGVPAQVIGQSELYVAAQTGVVDCAVSSITAKNISLHEVLPNFAYIAPYTLPPLQILVSQSAYDSLSDKGKGALQEAAATVQKESLEKYTKGLLEGQVAKELEEAGAHNLGSFPDADLKAIVDAARQVWKTMSEKRGEKAMAIYNQIIDQVGK